MCLKGLSFMKHKSSTIMRNHFTVLINNSNSNLNILPSVVTFFRKLNKKATKNAQSQILHPLVNLDERILFILSLIISTLSSFFDLCKLNVKSEHSLFSGLFIFA